MRGAAVPMLLVSFLMVGCNQPSESRLPTPAEEAVLIEEVAQTMGAFSEALNSHDPDRIFSFYRQDPSFLFLGCTDILSGWGTFESRVRPYYTMNTEVTFQQRILNIQILGFTTAAVALRGESSETPHLFWTMTLQKGEDGRWLITQEHESWPGCAVPRGPHMGTEGMPEGEMPPPASGIRGNRKSGGGAHSQVPAPGWAPG